MSFTYDLTTDVGKVRMLIADREEQYALFSDEEISAFLALFSASVFAAAAQALDTIAASEVLIQKKIKTLDIETDGPAVATALRAQAAALRERDNEDGAGFDIAEMVYQPFGSRERWWNQWQRGL